ncbi:biotin-dependent carboxyltransferase family protein [Pseudonocardia sp. C8]|uniref:5-oxoprolinase subunit C family protein n=1 Tax=Pseudonocardia sp. C8 TaxID=2762759 RepID=UPI0016426DEF|nr:biotin-dependent carboxyltransferase family protein [Pseudonocardia sp. C8]
MSTVAIAVTGAGWSTTYQDLGRQDAERLGVPTGGAADQYSAAVANLLVGNPRGAPLLESLGGGLAVVPDADVLVAVTGADSRVTVGGAAVPTWSPVLVPKGCELRVHELRRGVRSYLAVHGRVDAARFLGSAAPDPRMGFGQVLGPGSEVRVRTVSRGWSYGHFGQPLLRLPLPGFRPGALDRPVDVVPTHGAGAASGIRELVADSLYTVTVRSDHVGLRLDGPVKHPDDDTEIVSHGVPIGALEIPHADELIVLGRYRTLTAGYPIIGVAARACLPVLGQAGPGRRLRFRWVDRETAVRRSAEQEAALRALESATSDAFAALGLPGPCRPTE